MRNRLVCIGLLAVALSGQPATKQDSLGESIQKINKAMLGCASDMNLAAIVVQRHSQLVELTLQYIIDSVKRHPDDVEFARELNSKMQRIQNAK